VNEELSTLYKIQQIDLEVARLQQALAQLDTGAELERRIGALEAEQAELRRRQEAFENESLDCELEIRTLEEKRDRFNSQLYGGRVSNPRQLHDLEEEVAMLGREIRKVEDRLLELMEALESLRSQIAARESQLGQLTQALQQARAVHAETSGRLATELSQFEAQRQEEVSKVSAGALRRYDQIRLRSGNLGLVRVTGSDCPGCHIGLPSETIKQLKAGKAALTCDNCARLLYWQESE